jgi:hypothetical protein
MQSRCCGGKLCGYGPDDGMEISTAIATFGGFFICHGLRHIGHSIRWKRFDSRVEYET